MRPEDQELLETPKREPYLVTAWFDPRSWAVPTGVVYDEGYLSIQFLCFGVSVDIVGLLRLLPKKGS